MHIVAKRLPRDSSYAVIIRNPCNACVILSCIPMKGFPLDNEFYDNALQTL